MNTNELTALQQSAAQGDADAQYRLAMKHIYGDGAPEDNVRAAELLTLAAAQGHTEATYNLGICYHYGHGVEADLPRAYELYLRAAKAGYGKGMNLVGKFLAEGLHGETDVDEARRWETLALDSGDPDAVAYAQRMLAAME